jgi:uncharacterized 2Fe-2S/4Fe-4S cluster protein (DUF4445 family)
MQAEPGAIYRIQLDPHSGRLHGLVLGDDAPRGICGSGLVDAIALLREQGLLDISGRFVVTAEHPGYALLEGMRISQQNVDALQRAKGDIAAAAECLLERAGRSWRQLRRICVCGAFGRHLHLEHAQSIGLLPVLPEARFDLLGNAALMGAERMALDARGEELVASLRASSQLVPLTLEPRFEDRSIAHLPFAPILLGD